MCSSSSEASTPSNSSPSKSDWEEMLSLIVAAGLAVARIGSSTCQRENEDEEPSFPPEIA